MTKPVLLGADQLVTFIVPQELSIKILIFESKENIRDFKLIRIKYLMHHCGIVDRSLCRCSVDGFFLYYF